MDVVQKSAARVELGRDELEVVVAALRAAEHREVGRLLPLNGDTVCLPWDEGGARHWEGRTPSGEELREITRVHGLRTIAQRFKEAMAECEQAMARAATSTVSDVEAASVEGGSGARRLALVMDEVHDDARTDPDSDEEELPTEEVEVESETRAWARAHTRNDVMRRIREGLNARSDRTWSVTGSRGTAYGWIKIDAPPRRRTWDMRATSERHPDGLPVYEDLECGESGRYMSPDDRRELARLLGMNGAKNEVDHQGVSIPSGRDFYAEYVDRAEGREPSVEGTRYWD